MTIFSEPILSELFLLIGGSLAGLLLGAVPGLSPTMGVALLVPLTFSMPTDSGVLLLLAIYTASVAGGAVTAISIGIPGAPANVATILDGHPMAKNGKAKQALQLAFCASFVGGLIGVAGLAWLSPALAQIALAFRPADMFWVAVFGLTIVASMARGRLFETLFSGFLGAWVSSIGYSPSMGVPRFAYSDVVMGGIHPIVAIIGLFALPQILLCVPERRIPDGVARAVFSIRSVLAGFSGMGGTLGTLIRAPRTLIQGSLLGTVIGILPGAGGQVGGLIAYDQEYKVSRDKSRFGKGHPPGLIASEASNSATVPASLVPLLTLGIPGSPTAAVLLGAFLIHGIFPNPSFLTDHSALFETILWGLVVAHVLMAFAGIALSNIGVWVSQISPAALYPCVFAFALFGTYGINQNIDDLSVMVAVGILMFFGERIGMNAAAVLLGLIVGPLIEQNLQLSQMLAGPDLAGYLTDTWMTKGLILLTAASFAYGVVQSLLPHSAGDDAKAARSPRWGQPRWGQILALLAIGLGTTALGYVESQGAPVRSYDFPILMSVLMVAAAVLLGLAELRVRRSPGSAGGCWTWRPEVALFPKIAVIVGTVALVPYLGWYGAVSLGFVGLYLVFGANRPDLRPTDRRRFLVSAVVLMAVMMTAMYLLFSVALRVHFG